MQRPEQGHGQAQPGFLIGARRPGQQVGQVQHHRGAIWPGPAVALRAKILEQFCVLTRFRPGAEHDLGQGGQASQVTWTEPVMSQRIVNQFTGRSGCRYLISVGINKRADNRPRSFGRVVVELG